MIWLSRKTVLRKQNCSRADLWLPLSPSSHDQGSIEPIRAHLSSTSVRYPLRNFVQSRDVLFGTPVPIGALFVVPVADAPEGAMFQGRPTGVFSQPRDRSVRSPSSKAFRPAQALPG